MSKTASTTASTPAANPTQGGSYVRHASTGALTAVEKPAAAVADLRAEAQAPEEAAVHTTTTPPAQEA